LSLFNPQILFSSLCVPPSSQKMVPHRSFEPVLLYLPLFLHSSYVFDPLGQREKFPPVPLFSFLSPSTHSTTSVRNDCQRRQFPLFLWEEEFSDSILYPPFPLLCVSHLSFFRGRTVLIFYWRGCHSHVRCRVERHFSLCFFFPLKKPLSGDPHGFYLGPRGD